MKKLVYILVSSLLIVTLITLSVLTINLLNLKDDFILTGEVIQAQEEKEGCITSAGYTWDKEIGACIKLWEFDENKKRAAKIAINEMSNEIKNIANIKEIEKTGCNGCYNIKLLSDNTDLNIKLTDWKIKK